MKAGMSGASAAALGKTSMKDRLIKWFMAINSWIIRLSRGRIGSKLGTQTILILHTTGRTSGEERAIPIAYFDYEGKYLIVASNWGKDTHAQWYLNLKKTPRARLEIRGKVIAVMAHEALGEEYGRLWKFATDRNPPYLEYQKATTRHIPIVVFEPES
jgi:deazaflavin-dependent oxidoreductase (nitroreductase family)